MLQVTLGVSQMSRVLPDVAPDLLGLAQGAAGSLVAALVAAAQGKQKGTGGLSGGRLADVEAALGNMLLNSQQGKPFQSTKCVPWRRRLCIDDACGVHSRAKNMGSRLWLII